MRVIRALLLTVCGFFVLACTAQSAKEKSGPPLTVSEKTRVGIPKSGFGKEYLLSTSIIPQARAATSTAMEGRVVLFELFEDGVDMYESTRGRVVTEDLPARRLIATFPIISSDGNLVVIDFNAGMRRLSFNFWYNWGERFDPTVFERAAELPQARVFEVTSDDGVLSIRQAVQVRSRFNDPDLEARYEIRYFFSPYVKGGFESREMHPDETRYARFFTTQTQLEVETGRESSMISIFDLSKPVVFYVSENTPESLKEAVKDGILYWNKAFGRDVVEAQDAPEGVTAPDPSLSIIQWVPWDRAGFAYADILFDPLTGESLRGQAYLTSAFDFGGQAQARQLLRSLRSRIDEATEDKSEGDDDNSVSFFGSGLCRLDSVEFAIQLADGLEELLADPKLSEELVERLAQDYLREVTAHEVGHVLGLRHNFAGSLEATMSPEELDQFIVDYIADKDLAKYKDLKTSSSVMEYNDFKASVFIGWQQKNGNEALLHDTAAIRWGYFDDKTVVEDKLLFGTDEETLWYADVLMFDYGVDPLLAAYSDLSSTIKSLPNSVIERFIAARAPDDERDRKKMEAVTLSADSYAMRIAAPVRTMLRWFNKTTRSLKVENEYDFIGDLNQDERLQSQWKYLNEQVDALGGIDQLAFAHLPLTLDLKTKDKLEGVEVAPKIDAEKLSKSLKELLDSDAYSTFVGLDDETYSWTEDEKKIIIERGTKLFEKLEEAVLLQTLVLYQNAPRDLGLAATGKLSDEDSVAKLEERIIDFAKKVILARSKEERIKGKVDKAFVEVPDFEYTYEIRLAAAKALDDKMGSFESWAKEAKQSLNSELKSAVEESLNIGLFKDFDDRLLSRSLREWYLQEQDLLKLLPPGPKKGDS